MCILHIIDTINVGGAERLLVDFINEFKRRYPEEEHILVTLRGSNQLLPEVNQQIESFHCLNFSIANILQVVASLRKLINRSQVQVVHSHLFYSTLISRLALMNNPKVQLITTYHNMLYSKESPFYSWKYPFVDRLTCPAKKSFAIFVSHPVSKAVRKVVPGLDDFVILNNFASAGFTNLYKYRPDSQLRLVSIGNLKSVKNHIFALEELRLLNDNRVTLDIYGEGELNRQLQQYIRQHKLQVRLKGEEKITSQLLAKYDAFLMPSRSEGMPLALIEALTTGLPALLTDIPQLRETAGNAAFYFELKKEALCQILRQLLNDKSQLLPLAREAVNLKERFRLDVYVDVVRKIYQDKVPNVSGSIALE